MIGPWVSTSIYDIANVDLQFNAGADEPRAPRPLSRRGRPEAIYLIERLMDAAAREMKLDPAELRRPQHDQARADAIHERRGPDLR
jgi:carbon-monoxide dehydrogenase large subunit